jgi:hypothetical protein
MLDNFTYDWMTLSVSCKPSRQDAGVKIIIMDIVVGHDKSIPNNKKAKFLQPKFLSSQPISIRIRH